MEQFPGPERGLLVDPPPRKSKKLAKGEAQRAPKADASAKPNKYFALVSYSDKRHPGILQAVNRTELSKQLRLAGDSIAEVQIVIRGRVLPVKEERIVRIG